MTITPFHLRCLALLAITAGTFVTGRAEVWTLDSSFLPSLESESPRPPLDRRISASGKMVVYNVPSVVNGRPFASGMVQLNADGTLDDSFPWQNVQVMKLYPDGRLLVLESLSRFEDIVQFKRLLPGGSPDPTFIPTQAKGSPFRATLLADGRTVIWGGIQSVDGIPVKRMALIKASGGLDSSFTSPFTDSNDSVASVVTRPDGLGLYAGGNFYGIPSGRTLLTRLSLTGAVDSGFTVSLTTLAFNPTGIYPQPNGTVLISGGTNLIRVTSAGAPDATFAAGPIGTVMQYGPDPYAGKLIYLTKVTGVPAQRQLRRMNPDGTDDATFSAISTSDTDPFSVTMPEVGDDGNLYFGALTSARYNGHIVATRVSSSGVVDSAYSPRMSAPGTMTAYARQTDGKHLVAGAFSYVNGLAMPGANEVIRLNANGSTDMTFTALVLQSAVLGLFPLPGGKTIAVGSFPEAGAGANIIRLNANGTIDSTFQPIVGAAFSMTYFRYNVTLDSSGYIYAVTQEGALVIKRYTPDGQLDPTFTSAAISGPAIGLCATTDGELAVARQAGVGSYAIARLTHTGTLRGTMNYSYTNSEILGMAALPGGDVFVASLQSITRIIVLARAKPSGPPSYLYTRFTFYNTSPIFLTLENRLDMAGAMLDLIREDSADPSVASTMATPGLSSRLFITAGGDGQAFVGTDGDSGYSLIKYQRTVLAPPSLSSAAPAFYFTDNPPSPTNHRAVGDSFSITSANVEGLTPTYQWLKNGAVLAGKNGFFLSLSPLQASDAGVYTLKASNPYGTAISDPVELIIDGLATVAISSQPNSQVVTAGTAATFTVTASSPAPISYSWWRDGVVIPNATGDTFTLNNVTPNDSGAVFYAKVSSNGVLLTSNSATLTVASPAARTIFGTVAGGGSFAIYARADGEATMIVTLPNGRGSFLIKFIIGTDGRFTTTLPTSRRTISPLDLGNGGKITGQANVTISGQISGSVFTGSSTAGDSLTGSVQSATGTTAALSGFYDAPLLYSANATVALIVGTDGSMMALSSNALGGQAVSGTTTAGGNFTLTLADGTSLRGTFNPSSGSITGDILVANQVTGHFGGLSSTTSRTDRLVNISTRGLVGDGEKAIIAGFVITGTTPKTVLVRASGPALTGYGLGGAMDNPSLTILRGNTVVASNEDWSATTDATLISTTATRVGGFAFPLESKDAALVATLDPGVYSAQVTRAAGSAVGLTLVEVYDSAQSPGTETQKLVNISTRGEVRTGQNIMIAGFVITGNVPKKVLIRGVGPTLGSYGVGETLADPILNLYQGDTLAATNDNWDASGTGGTEITTAAAQVGAFPLAVGGKDAAMVVTLAPGIYSAQVSGANNSTGIVLLEVYEVPPP
ncbi:MAG: Immunoglobulin I-set domain protein [Verrucomicrobia bacterium]|nr:Immunoglobulin I-set domain protein [Verrucomicrobiota bacterium]